MSLNHVPSSFIVSSSHIIPALGQLQKKGWESDLDDVWPELGGESALL